MGHKVTFSPAIANVLLDVRFRLVADILNILLYIKICGFSGVRLWASVADLLFSSWLIMEVTLVVGYFHQRNDTEGNCEGYFPVLDEPSTDPVTFSSFLVFVEATIPIYILLHHWPSWSTVEGLVPASVYWVADHTAMLRPFDTLFDVSGVLFLPLLIASMVWMVLLTIFNVFVFFIFIIPLLLPIALFAGFVVGLLWLLNYAATELAYITPDNASAIWAKTLVITMCSMYLVYFIVLYDATGTWKSSWTEYLGKKMLLFFT